MSLAILLLVAALSHFAFLYAEEAPHAPALADSHWSIAHASTWNSDYTSNLGPASGKDAVPQFLVNGNNVSDIKNILAAADPITLVQSSVAGYTWGSSISSVFQLKTDDNGVSIINTFFRDYNFEYHGAYSLLAHDGTYYAATKTSIQAYNNEVPLDFSTPIVLVKEYTFDFSLENGEHLVGLTITHDAPESAFLIVATSFGQVAGVSLDFTKATNVVRIPGIENVDVPDHFVSNSIACDGSKGGIYVVTSYSLARIQWTARTRKLTLDWNTPYGTGKDQWYWGRLGPGSGTSPTIVGPQGEPEFVVINDGLTPTNILFFSAKSGALVGKKAVTFGADEASAKTTTDQSIVVKGYKAVVVNNWVAESVTPFCSEWFASLNVTESLKHECPFIFGAFVTGVEQFEINPLSKQVKSVWANDKVSCTSSIPVVTDDDVLYCLGKRERKLKRSGFS